MSTAALPLPLLQRAQIAAPCHVRWEDMKEEGNGGHMRHCGSCERPIYNIAGMTSAEAEALLRSAFNDDGSPREVLCARIYRRADGTVMTADCPVGLRALRAKTGRAVARIAGALGLTALVAWAAAAEQRRAYAGWRPMQPFAMIGKALGKTPPRARSPFVLGTIIAPRPQSKEGSR
ncbi:MAG: hypothetical protein QM783_19835 [Phycisphaerales bacterium]